MTDFPIKFEKDLRTELLRQFQQYLRDEFDVEPGDLATGLFVDFAGTLLGPLYYNAGLRDALDVANQHAEAVTVDILALERESNPRR